MKPTAELQRAKKKKALLFYTALFPLQDIFPVFDKRKKKEDKS